MYLYFVEIKVSLSHKPPLLIPEAGWEPLDWQTWIKTTATFTLVFWVFSWCLDGFDAEWIDGCMGVSVCVPPIQPWEDKGYVAVEALWTLFCNFCRKVPQISSPPEVVSTDRLKHFQETWLWPPGCRAALVWNAQSVTCITYQTHSVQYRHANGPERAS